MAGIKKAILNELLRRAGVPEQVKSEWAFAIERKRRFRFDFAFTERKLAIEVEGGVWIQGRHTSPQGFIKDMEKYNLACELGWQILRYTPQQLLKPETIEQIKITYNNKGNSNGNGNYGK